MADYSKYQGYQDALGALPGYLQNKFQNVDSGLIPVYGKQISQHADTFSNLFKNAVGRDPNESEINKFFSDYVGQNTDSLTNSNVGKQQTRDEIAQFIGDTFKGTADQESQTKLSDLSTKYGSLADSYMEMGKKSLSGLSDSLRDYQVKLFDKLRPQLNLAAQAGGYADSGGQTLQEEGALRDLGTDAMGYMIPAQQQLESQANQIRLGGEAAPLDFASSIATQQPGMLSSMGTEALGRNWDIYNGNLNFNRQMELMKQQGRTVADLQPSFGTRLGNSFADKFGGNLADLGKDATKGGFGKLTGGGNGPK